MNDVVSVALMGLGGHGATIRRAIKKCPKLKVVACFDINDKLMDETAKEFGCKKFASYDDLLENSDAKAVIISTPNFLHFEQAFKAIEKDKDVFIEKPITVKVEEAEKLIKLAYGKGLIIQVGHNTRKREVFQKAKDIITSGKLGEIVIVEANISMPTGLGNFPDWKKDKEKCPLLPMTQLGIHFVDTLMYLIGDIVEVFCFARNFYLDVEDTVMSLVKFSNGIIGVISSSYVTADEYEIRVYGMEGILKCYLDKVYLIDRSDNVYISEHPEGDESYVRELCEFADCVIKREKPEVDGLIGLKNLKVVEAMMESYISGKAVKL